MKREHTYRVRRTAGFTLVELIVVLVMVSVIAGFAVPTFLGFVDDNKAKQCEINRKKVVSYLEDMLVTNPDATLEDVFNTYRKEDGDQDIDKDFTRCPVTGKGYTCVGNTVVCEAHGETTAVKRSDKSVTAKLDNALKEEKQTEAGGGIPEPEGGGSNTLEPNKPDQTAKLEVEIYSNLVELSIGETRSLEATVRSEHCKDFSYRWQVAEGNDNDVVAFDTRDGAKVSLTGTKGGSVQIFCCVDAMRDDGTPISAVSNYASVTVKQQPKLQIKVEPNPLTLTVGKINDSRLTVSVIDCENCEVTGYSWTSSNPSIITVSDGQETSTVTALKEGESTITCTVSASSEGRIITATANTQVIAVKQQNAETENGDLLVNVPNSLKINGGTGKSMGEYINPSVNAQGGKWSVISGPIHFQQNSDYVYADGPGPCKMKYEVGNRIAEIEAEVVYPHTSFGIEPSHEITVEIGQETVITGFYTAYQDAAYKDTTDGPVTWNVTKGADLISYTTDGNKNQIVHITALKAGRVEVSASLQNGYTGEWTTCTVPIQINYKKITEIIAQPVEVQEDSTTRIQIGFIPENDIDPSQLTFSYSGSTNEKIATVSSDGIVFGKNEGTCTVNVVASGNGMYLKTTCEIKVTENPKRIKQIWVDKIEVMQGQSAQINPRYEPKNADTNVRYEYKRLEEWKNLLTIADNTVVAGNELGTERVQVTAFKGDIELASCEFDVEIIVNPKLLSDIQVEPQSICLQQGEQAKIAKNTDGDAEDADIIISPSTPEATLNDADIIYSKNDGENAATVGSDGIIRASTDYTGSVTIFVKARRKSDGKEFSKNINVTVISSKCRIDNTEMDVMSWNMLRNYLKKKEQDPTLEELSLSQLYLNYVNDWTQSLYVLRPGAVLSWNPQYNNMTFDELLNQDIGKQFIKVQKDSIHTWPVYSWDSRWFSPGDVLRKEDGVYYVYVGEAKNIDTEQPDILSSDFVRIWPKL